MSTTGSPPDTPSFEERPTLQYAATVGMQAALVGAFVSSVQNALGTHSRGASGFLSRTGGTIGFFGVFQQPFHLEVQVLIGDYRAQPPWVQRSLPPNPSLRTNGRRRMR